LIIFIAPTLRYHFDIIDDITPLRHYYAIDYATLLPPAYGLRQADRYWLTLRLADYIDISDYASHYAISHY
jgi:hypothetical protein